MEMSWLIRLSEAGALGPIATMFAASIGASAALAIAFLAYPWQKKKDRELQVNLEKRAAYARFFRASGRFYSVMVNFEDVGVSEASSSLREAINDIYIYASPSLLHECKALTIKYLLFHAIRSGHSISPRPDYREAMRKLSHSYLHHENTALALARAEVMGLDFATASSDVVIKEDVGYVRELND